MTHLSKYKFITNLFRKSDPTQQIQIYFEKVTHLSKYKFISKKRPTSANTNLFRKTDPPQQIQIYYKFISKKRPTSANTNLLQIYFEKVPHLSNTKLDSGAPNARHKSLDVGPPLYDPQEGTEAHTSGAKVAHILSRLRQLQQRA